MDPCLLCWGAQSWPSTPDVSRKRRVGRKDHFPSWGGSPLANAAQGAAGRLCQRGGIAGSSSWWCPARPFLQSCSPSSQSPAGTGAWACSSPGAGLGVSVSWTSWGPELQSVEVPLDGSTTPWSVSHSSQFYMVCKLAQGALCPIISRSVTKVLISTGPDVC